MPRTKKTTAAATEATPAKTTTEKKTAAATETAPNTENGERNTAIWRYGLEHRRFDRSCNCGMGCGTGKDKDCCQGYQAIRKAGRKHGLLCDQRRCWEVLPLTIKNNGKSSCQKCVCFGRSFFLQGSVE